MLSRRRAALFAIPLFAALGGGAYLYAQMEGGDRGIMPIDSSQTLEVGGLHVDVGGKDATEARYNGWKLAQRMGFRKLWAKMNNQPESAAPNLSDTDLDDIVSSVIVQNEQIGPNRYIADLGILFDRAKAGQILGAPGQAQRSAPMLLIPIVTSGGTDTSVETRNLWQRAWAQFRTSQSPIDYIRVSGNGVDPLLVNAAITRRPGRGWWRNVMDLYGGANVLIAEVQLHRLYPGGPARAVFIGSFGPDRRPLGSFTLTAKDSADLPRMMNEGVERMDQLFAQALAAGIVKGDSSLVIQAPPPPVDDTPEVADTPKAQSIRMLLLTQDAATLEAAVAQIRGIAGVTGVSENSVALGGTSTLTISATAAPEAIRDALIALGYRATYLGGAIEASRSVARAAPRPQPGAPTPPAGQPATPSP
ncbi:heavy-metal-associated domain-containing protein [Sphingomonas sp. ASV193]|uniref:heavy-metal-associated domain-containing protein n=1 Tax=Sphingomonas sp. ASV193 TaxID=3144405 RepID=UPI0032E87EE7